MLEISVNDNLMMVVDSLQDEIIEYEMRIAEGVSKELECEYTRMIELNKRLMNRYLDRGILIETFKEA